jgi:hypothetical protein
LHTGGTVFGFADCYRLLERREPVEPPSLDPLDKPPTPEEQLRRARELGDSRFGPVTDAEIEDLRKHWDPPAPSFGSLVNGYLRLRATYGPMN